MNETCECSESPNFYNRFWRFYCSDEVRTSIKNVWITPGVASLTCTCRRSPKHVRKPSKNRSKTGPKSIKNLYRKLCTSVFSFGGLLESLKVDFFQILDPNMVPKGSQNGTQNRWKNDPEAVWPPGRVPRCSQNPPGPHFGWISDRFSIDFSLLLEDFWHAFRSYFQHDVNRKIEK